MRDLDHALSLIEAVVRAVKSPRHAEDAARLGRREPQRRRSLPRAPKPPACSSSPCMGARAASSSRAAPTGRRARGEGCRAHSRHRQRRHHDRPSARRRRSRPRAPTASWSAAAPMARPGCRHASPRYLADRDAIPVRRRSPSRPTIALRARRGDARRTTARSSACAMRASTSAGIWQQSGRPGRRGEGLAPPPVHRRRPRASAARPRRLLRDTRRRLAA